MRALLIAALLLQPGPRPPLAPAETLLEPQLLRQIEKAALGGPSVRVIQGTDSAAGEIAIVCATSCEAAQRTMTRLNQVARPARTIRLLSPNDRPDNVKTALFLGAPNDKTLHVVRGLWSTAGIGDEVVEIFARHAVGSVVAKPFEEAGQPKWDSAGIPTTTIIPAADSRDPDRVSFVAAASAYVLATLPNAGSEALLSHLTVGAHERLAEDGRHAVAMMGNQQRAGADVLIMFGQAIEREQRRMRSFERFMPTPVDPMLHTRILDMEKGITSVWTSMGITSSPFVPTSERLRGRGGEDKRIVARTRPGAIPRVELPTAFLKFENVESIVDELGNFVDGSRSISDIRDAVSAEFSPIALSVVVEYFERLARAGAVTLQ